MVHRGSNAAEKFIRNKTKVQVIYTLPEEAAGPQLREYSVAPVSIWESLYEGQENKKLIALSRVCVFHYFELWMNYISLALYIPFYDSSDFVYMYVQLCAGIDVK